MSYVKIDYIGKGQTDWRTLPHEVLYTPTVPGVEKIKSWLKQNVGVQGKTWDYAWQRTQYVRDKTFVMAWRFKTKESKALFVLTWTYNDK